MPHPEKSKYRLNSAFSQAINVQQAWRLFDDQYQRIIAAQGRDDADFSRRIQGDYRDGGIPSTEQRVDTQGKIAVVGSHVPGQAEHLPEKAQTGKLDLKAAKAERIPSITQQLAKIRTALCPRRVDNTSQV